MMTAAQAYRPRAALPISGRGVRSTLRSPISHTPREPDVRRTIRNHRSDQPLRIRYSTMPRHMQAAAREDLPRRCELSSAANITTTEQIEAPFDEDQDGPTARNHARPELQGSTPERDIALFQEQVLLEADNAPEGGFTSHPAVSVTSSREASKCEHTTPPLRHMIDVASRITHHAFTAPHETCLSEKILIKADDAPDQVGCCDSLNRMISSVTYLNTALEAAQHNVVAVSGDATGYPGVMSSWSGTHPDAVSFRIWSQAPVTPRPLGDGLKWSNDHEIYQAPSPTFDRGLELFGKHNGILPDDTHESRGIPSKMVREDA